MTQSKKKTTKRKRTKSKRKRTKSKRKRTKSKRKRTKSKRKSTKRKSSKKKTKRKTRGAHSESAAARAARKKAARKESQSAKRKKYPRRKTEHGVKVTPRKAKNLLASNFEGQRNLMPSKVNQYVGILRRGLWKETGEAITVDWNGTLINGQHRLAAIIKSGIPAKLDITYGVAPEAFDVIDTGATRKLYDVLPVRYPKQVSSMYRLYLDFVNTEGSHYTSFGRRSPAAYREDRAGAIEWAQKHEKALVHIVETCYVDKEARVLLRPPAVFMAFYFWVRQRNAKLADEFFRTLIDGLAFEDGKTDPIYQLRKSLVNINANYRTKRGKTVPIWQIGGLLIKSWNSWIHREPVRQLRMAATENWPELTDRKTRARKSKTSAA